MNTNNNIKWHKASEYVDKMSKVKDYCRSKEYKWYI